MCYAIPGKIVAIHGNTGVVDYFGDRRNILLDLEVQLGDYVYAQGGILIRKIPPNEALAILATWHEVFAELKKTDALLAKLQPQSNALGILQKINHQKSLTRQEILNLYALDKPDELAVLYEIANHLRQREHGNASCVHGILEFSNHCRNNCHYCGIRRATSIHRYRMDLATIIAAAQDAVDNYGFRAIVLQSGEDTWYNESKLSTLVQAMRSMGVLVFLSIGARSKRLYHKLYQAGARAALLRFETSNPNIFAKLRPNTNLDARIELIQALKQMGYIVATGFMLGLPTETADDVVNNILLTKYLAPDMYSLGPFIPSQHTPLATHPPITKDAVLKTIAITRLVVSNANILVTTALETLDNTAKKTALLAGANSMMLNITPALYQPWYTIYDNKVSPQSLAYNVQETVQLLYSLGRAPTDISCV